MEENKIKIFNNPQFGQLRTLEIDEYGAWLEYDGPFGKKRRFLYNRKGVEHLREITQK